MTHPVYRMMAPLCLVLLAACGGGDGPAALTAPPRVLNTSCIAAARTGTDTVTRVRAFPNLSFNAPVALIPAPDGQTMYVVERAGRIMVFANDDKTTAASVFLDIQSQVDTSGEGGLLSMAFDPGYAGNGFVYVYYTAPVSNPVSGQRVLISHVSRFTANAQRSALDPASELQLLSVDQPYTNHNGGQIAFGRDGYLYIGLGDGGSANDPQHNGQNTATLLASILRIDVSQSTPSQPYRIPSGNPFAGSASCAAGACPEIYAWGLRNPWRWSFDRLNGDLWVGDVGQDMIEEIDRVELGKNYGWGCYEGTRFNTAYSGACPGGIAYTPPVYQYSHSQGGNAITGGFRYRGTAIAGLAGQYIFGDSGSGNIWALSDPTGPAPQRRLLLSTGHALVAFGQDFNGELYAVYLDNGQIDRLVPAPGGATTAAFASSLSATGCADPSDPRQPAPGMIAYQVNSPLWSDGANKQRWMALPDTARIHVQTDNDWSFPIGTVLRKDFYLNGQIVETRLFARHTDGGWAGYSYAWNAAQTDAMLLSDTRTVTAANGQSWTYPSPAQCLQCHTVAAGRALGPETAQLNREVTDPASGANLNQLQRFAQLQLFDAPLPDPAGLPRLAEPGDTAQTLNARARAYLHANCANCHQPVGGGAGNMDLRYSVAFAAMNICDAAPTAGDVAGASLLLAPGDSGNSIIYQRMHDTGTFRMPPLGSTLEDLSATQLISNWVNALATCPS